VYDIVLFWVYHILGPVVGGGGVCLVMGNTWAMSEQACKSVSTSMVCDHFNNT